MLGLLITILVVSIGVLIFVVVLATRRSGDKLLADRLVQEQMGIHSKIGELIEGGRAQSEGLSKVREQLYQELIQARKDISILTAIQEERAKQDDQAFRAIQAIKNIMAGSHSKGIAGETVILEITKVLPKSMWASDLQLGGRKVEFAICLPDGRYLPLDSKMPIPSQLSALEETGEVYQDEKGIAKELSNNLRNRAKEVGEYILPPRTLDFALIAVPPLIFEITLPVHYECYKNNRVIVISYNLLLPFLLQLYSIYQQYAATSRLDLDLLQGVVQKLSQHIEEATSIVESKLSRGITQVDNASRELSQVLSQARIASQSIYKLTEPQDRESLPK